MSELGDTDPLRTPVTQTTTRTTRTYLTDLFTIDSASLRRITGMIQLGFGILNGLIGLRFLLKLMAANPANIFASFIYTITTPFLWIFSGLTTNPSFEGIVIEFHDLIAIGVYFMLAWVIIRGIWLMFARLR